MKRNRAWWPRASAPGFLLARTSRSVLKAAILARLTNHRLGAGKVVSLHEGRDSQEKVFGELKSQVQLDYVPCRRLHANQTWLLGAIMAHNLQREQTPPPRALAVKRTARWA